MLYVDWFKVFLVAVMGASLTNALRTGSLAPIFPTITQKEKPTKYWLGVVFYSWFVLGFFAGLVWFLLRNRIGGY